MIKDDYKLKNITVVDDDSIVLSTLKMLLEIEGFSNVTYFEKPKDALDFVKENEQALVISDFLMPEMNGIEFLAEIKKMYPEMSTILLTGYADKENAIKAINTVGIYKYIEKPWDNEDLILNIKNALERSGLISELNKKIEELSQAKLQLEKYSHSLEEIVLQKTEDLVQSNTKLNAIINFCADGIIIVSKDKKIVQVNPAFENMTGLSSCLLVDTDISNLFTTSCSELEKITKDKNILVRNLELKNNIEDKSFPVEINFAPILADNTENTNYVGVVRNVSLQKEMERLRDDFIATLTHDLRTPLLAAIQTLQFFLDGTLGEVEERQKTLLDTMKKSNEDMLGLVNALLEVYKYESGKLNLCKTSFSLHQFIDDCLKQIQSLADKKKIQISKNLNSLEDAEIFADRNELRRVMLNLCGNALNHTGESGVIEISAQAQDKDLQISVKDTGTGMPKGDVTKLFKRFSQGSSKKRSAGTGLGLYLSRQIVEAHGGKIWAESEVGKGSVFTFLIPESLRIKERLK